MPENFMPMTGTNVGFDPIGMGFGPMSTGSAMPNFTYSAMPSMADYASTVDLTGINSSAQSNPTQFSALNQTPINVGNLTNAPAGGFGGTPFAELPFSPIGQPAQAAPGVMPQQMSYGTPNATYTPNSTQTIRMEYAAPEMGGKDYAQLGFQGLGAYSQFSQAQTAKKAYNTESARQKEYDAMYKEDREDAKAKAERMQNLKF